MYRFASRPVFFGLLALCAWGSASTIHAQLLTDGKVRFDAISDDFDDPSWTFTRATNFSSNVKWRKGGRNIPDALQRVAPPAGGIAGSTGALSFRTDNSGSESQDDLPTQIYETTLGSPIARSDLPISTVRVYLPNFGDWTDSTGFYNFGFRVEGRSRDLVSGSNVNGVYYPSIWLQETNSTKANLIVRMGDGLAGDVNLGSIDQSGWWTFGLGFDEEGIGRYYAKSGVGDLTASDEIYDTTQFLFGSDARMDTMAYNFFSLGHPQSDTSLSTAFVVDDFSVYVVPEPSSAIALTVISAVLLRRRARSL